MTNIYDTKGKLYTPDDFKICSAKNCNNIPDWIHYGLGIALCQICFEKIDFKHKFERIRR